MACCMVICSPSEINKLLVTLLNLLENFTSVRPLTLLNKWSSRLPDARLHPISVWDDFATNRYSVQCLLLANQANKAGRRESKMKRKKSILLTLLVTDF